MTDDAELAGLDPFDIFDGEAARVEAHLATLTDAQWDRASRCEGWRVRDVLAHLTSSEGYNQACLDGTVQAFLQAWGERGVTDLDSANALGVEDYADRATDEVLEAWETAGAANRRRFRERGDGTVDTSVGDYPCRWQVFHLASELATHADDMYVPVTPNELRDREAWRAHFSRFALAETKPELTITTESGRTRVRGADTEVEVDDHRLIEGVAGRLGSDDGLDLAARVLLSTMP